MGEYDPVDLNVFTNRYDEVCDALEQLPSHLREIVERRVWGGESFRSIGDSRGVSKQAIHKSYQVALNLLGDLLGDSYENPATDR